MPSIRRTPLFAVHQQLGARLIDFHGWELPVQYRGIMAEHLAVRSAAGLFDVSHMGELWVEGAEAGAALQHLLTNDLRRVDVGRVQYTFMCNDDGGVIDDLTVLRTAEATYLLCVNAANTAADWFWLRGHLPAGVAARDASEETALLALQGPLAASALTPLVPLDLTGMRRFRCLETSVMDVPSLISRTGYTGEDGFELFLPAESAADVWQALLEGDVQPCGLGARDTLRIEAGFPLHGQDLDTSTSPIEAGLERFVAFDAGVFIGRPALADQVMAGPLRRRIGLRLEGRAVARQGFPIFNHERRIGEVTSGTFSPSLQSSIAMGYVEADALGDETSAPQNGLRIEIRGKQTVACLCGLPFYPPPATT